MDPSPIVKRAVLHNISALCIFLGRQKTNDVILSHMITYLNDRDWLLRQAFFESIVDVAACAGGRSLDEYILPLMVQALSGECSRPRCGHESLTGPDVEENVVARVLSALTSLCELGLFQKMRIWELMSATLCFFYHPNAWIRQGGWFFFSSIACHANMLVIRRGCVHRLGSKTPPAERRVVYPIPIPAPSVAFRREGD